jgi:hypothetical protein
MVSHGGVLGTPVVEKEKGRKEGKSWTAAWARTEGQGDVASQCVVVMKAQLCVCAVTLMRARRRQAWTREGLVLMRAGTAKLVRARERLRCCCFDVCAYCLVGTVGRVQARWSQA